MTETIDAEVIDDEPGTELEVRPAGTLWGTEDPSEFLVKASATASALAEVVRKQGLVVRIRQGEHVKVEGWTMLGSLLGVFPVAVWTRQLPDAQGWEARVEARTLAGQVVGSAEAQCTRTENQWSFEPTGRDGQKLPPRDDYALRSMAQTRATSKALRMPLGFVMTLAGFEATPAEEMPPRDDVPFEDGPAQDPAKTHDDQASGTGGAETRALVDELLQLAARLGTHTVTESAIAKNKLEHQDRPDLHVKWLKRQVVIAHEKLAELVGDTEAGTDGNPPPPPEPAGATPPASPPEGVAGGVNASAAQVKLLWTTIRKLDVQEAEVRLILRRLTGQESTKQIPFDKFEAVYNAVVDVGERNAVEIAEAESQFPIPDSAR